MLEAEKRFAVRRNADEIHARYEEYFRFAQQELEEKLQVELRDTDEKRNKELQKAIVKARIDTTHDVLRKIRPQINLIVTSLYNEFEQIHRAQREKMIADFNKIMRKQYLKQDVKIREIEKKKMEELHVQRRELEIQNVMNIIYIFCMEKLRCSSQLQAVQKHFEVNILSVSNGNLKCICTYVSFFSSKRLDEMLKEKLKDISYLTYLILLYDKCIFYKMP
ncbi:uncharacterized protein LOC112459188 [Temnothorax curvispinosus]|uniref:Uncharacterized protein LOC112459188 n=1 Tax=Temnothorax curvispinosus TaxID=300111 RepID=A0A6J1QBC2_9HYME|nr:uncharacterized protein LOC112459188 [Temnothorax curvispinosus]